MKKKKLIETINTLEAFCEIKNKTIADLRADNLRLNQTITGLAMKINTLDNIVELKETSISSCERAIRYHETKFNNTAEFTAALMRYSNEN